jgi:hypothetical protein
MLQGYNEARLKSSFRKFYLHYGDLVYNYKFVERFSSYFFLDCLLHISVDDG